MRPNIEYREIISYILPNRILCGICYVYTAYALSSKGYSNLELKSIMITPTTRGDRRWYDLRNGSKIQERFMSDCLE